MGTLLHPWDREDIQSRSSNVFTETPRPWAHNIHPKRSNMGIRNRPGPMHARHRGSVQSQQQMQYNEAPSAQRGYNEEPSTQRGYNKAPSTQQGTHGHPYRFVAPQTTREDYEEYNGYHYEEGSMDYEEDNEDQYGKY